MRHIGILGSVVLSACAPRAASPPPSGPPAAVAAVPAPGAQLTDTTTYDARGEHRRVTGTQVALAGLPIADWLGLPMLGTADVDIDVRVPLADGLRDWSHATGSVALRCTRCQLGGEHAKLRPTVKDERTRALVGDGFTFGPVLFDRVDVAATLADGKLAITKWVVASADVDLDVKLAVTFDAEGSHAEGCVRYRARAALQQRDPKTYAAITLAGGAQAADGMSDVRLAGPLGDLRRIGQVCDGSVPLPPVDAAPGPQRPELAPPAAPPPPAAPLTDKELAAKIAAGVAKTDDTHYTLARDLVTSVLSDPTLFGKGVRVVPVVANGKPDGFKLYAIRPDSLVAHLGLENGDTVRAINGYALTSADTALEAYTKVREASSLAVDIVRRGKQLTMIYAVRD